MRCRGGWGEIRAIHFPPPAARGSPKRETSVQKFKSRQQWLSQPLAGFAVTNQSGREDLNFRPHGPEPCALAKLSYAPNPPIILVTDVVLSTPTPGHRRPPPGSDRRRAGAPHFAFSSRRN